jgi:hypothetical protein
MLDSLHLRKPIAFSTFLDLIWGPGMSKKSFANTFSPFLPAGLFFLINLKIHHPMRPKIRIKITTKIPKI